MCGGEREKVRRTAEAENQQYVDINREYIRAIGTKPGGRHMCKERGGEKILFCIEPFKRGFVNTLRLDSHTAYCNVFAAFLTAFFVGHGANP